MSAAIALCLMFGLVSLLGEQTAMAQNPQIIHAFGSITQDAYNPEYGALAKDCNGNLWGTAVWGGQTQQKWGAVYKLPYNTLSAPFYSLGSNLYDGVRPYYGLTLDNHIQSNGQTLCHNYGTVFYGTASGGGQFTHGAAFKCDPQATQTCTTIHSFAGTVDGRVPAGNVAIDASGNIWGTSQYDGPNSSCGTVWELSPPVAPSTTWTEPFLYTFPISQYNGCNPNSVVFDGNGNLWGTTNHTGYVNGQAVNGGTVFVFVNTNGTLASTPQIIHAFSGGLDGQAPAAQLVTDTSGNNLYGTTEGVLGQYCNGGTVFKISPNGSGGWGYSVIYAFPGKDANGNGLGDGYTLYGGVALDASGNVYGTTAYTASNGPGTIFKLTNDGQSKNACISGAWSATVLHPFSGNDGSGPMGTVIWDSSGTHLVGTTVFGGSQSEGVAYSFSIQ